MRWLHRRQTESLILESSTLHFRWERYIQLSNQMRKAEYYNVIILLGSRASSVGVRRKSPEALPKIMGELCMQTVLASRCSGGDAVCLRNQFSFPNEYGARIKCDFYRSSRCLKADYVASAPPQLGKQIGFKSSTHRCSGSVSRAERVFSCQAGRRKNASANSSRRRLNTNTSFVEQLTVMTGMNRFALPTGGPRSKQELLKYTAPQTIALCKNIKKLFPRAEVFV